MSKGTFWGKSELIQLLDFANPALRKLYDFIFQLQARFHYLSFRKSRPDSQLIYLHPLTRFNLQNLEDLVILTSKASKRNVPKSPINWLISLDTVRVVLCVIDFFETVNQVRQQVLPVFGRLHVYTTQFEKSRKWRSEKQNYTVIALSLPVGKFSFFPSSIRSVQNPPIKTQLLSEMMGSQYLDPFVWNTDKSSRVNITTNVFTTT